MSRLQQKLVDNALLRKREEILGGFSGELHAELTNAKCILSTELSELIKRWHWAGPVPGEVDRTGKPAEWRYQDADNLAGLGRLAGVVRLPDKEGYLWLSREAPVMAVHCNVWNRHSWHLMNYVGQCPDALLAFVTQDNSAGLLISEYVGSLPPDRRTNKHEIVYELVTW
jgi:hypothetical protein